jgi:altronate hydrolase
VQERESNGEFRADPDFPMRSEESGLALQQTLRLHADDNVVVALAELQLGTQISIADHVLTLRQTVPAKHKLALLRIPQGGTVTMYGLKVGQASQTIEAGEILTSQNVRHDADTVSRRTHEYTWTPPNVSRWQQRTFEGFHREDGQVGTRNYWLVVPLVFCENRNIGVLKQAFEQGLGFATPSVYQQQVGDLARIYQAGDVEQIRAYKAQARKTAPHASRIFSHVDGVKFLLHEGGCGGTRQDAHSLCGLIAGYIHHPNVAGATVLSLGCQNAQVSVLSEELNKRDPHFSKPLYIFEQQKSGEEFAMLSEAVRQTFLGLIEADKCRRSPATLSNLSIGLKCGGSDGFSGLSANPAIGHVSDLVAALGGKSILSEFPELCGVEQELVNRSVSESVSGRFMKLMKSYAARAKAVGSGFDMNPSPGNIRDGLLTDAMKSAGAAKKGGTSPVTAVLDYPEYISKAGLNLQCTPGNDVECVTAQVGAGANIVLFTTGLGTPTGNPIAPVVKISTNSELARKMPDIIDIDTGGIISGGKNIEQVGGEILERAIQIASGETKTAAELLGQDDFIPWKRGVSL